MNVKATLNVGATVTVTVNANAKVKTPRLLQRQT